MAAQLPKLVNLDRAYDQMARAGFDAMIGVGARNVFYLSGAQSDWLFDVPLVAAAILPASLDKPATLIVHDVELTSLAAAASWMPELRVYRAEVCGEFMPHYAVSEGELTPGEQDVVSLMDKTGPTAANGFLPAIRSALIDAGLAHGRIAVDDCQLVAALKALLPHIECVHAPGLFANIRMVKTPTEIAIMRENAGFNQAALQVAIAAIGEGVLWADVERAYHVAVANRGGRPAAFYVGAGRRSGGLQPDGNYPINKGDQLCFDAMATWQRYHADMQRTVVLGTPSSQVERYWSALSKGIEAAYPMMGPGVSTSDIRQAALAAVRNAGIPTFRHAFIHGLGLDHIELPALNQGFVDFRLEPGMIVNMDLEVCEIGFGGVYYEESILITEQGSEPLLPSERALIRL